MIMFSEPVTFAPNCATASAKQFATALVQPESEKQPEDASYLPVGHAMQPEDALAPGAEEKPAPHSVQVAEAAASEYLVDGHEVQLLAPQSAYLPAGQLAHDATLLALLAALYVPSVQLMQLLLPAAAEYFPLGQGLHVAVALDVEPALPYAPAAQTVPPHDPCTTFAWYLPDGQAVHTPAPASANLPARHAVPQVAPALDVTPSAPE